MSPERARRVRRTELARVAALALLVLVGPTVGDVGSCGQAVVELDAQKFFDEKRGLDCAACSRCGYDGERCLAACTKDAPEQSFPPGCFPLVHDGEVCLNALRAAGCSEYAAYVDDLAPTVPGECNFCPRDDAAALGAGADVVEEAP